MPDPTTLQWGADRMALAILRLVDSGVLDARSEAADALLDYADTRYDVHNGTGIQYLRGDFPRPKTYPNESYVCPLDFYWLESETAALLTFSCGHIFRREDVAPNPKAPR